jgi:hypothetical protein
MLRFSITGGIAVGLFALIACNGSDGADGSNGANGSNGSNASGSSGNANPSCGKAGRSGDTNTKCGTCAAGQYCDDEDYNTCKLGCTSDNNCGESEYCYRVGGGARGTCQSCSSQPGTAPAASSCQRNTVLDRECASPGKAYECASTSEEPKGVGSCVQADLPQVFCCGGGQATECNRNSMLDQPVCQGRKAFDCPPDEEPTGKNCSQGPNGTTYCCD